MLNDIINNIQEYLTINPIEILPGNIVIGKGVFENICVEVRYIYNRDLFFQTLVDDIWYEDFIWRELNSTNNKKHVIYICHNSIEIESESLEIEKDLNISRYFSSIVKFFLPITDMLKKILDKKFPFVNNNNAINSLKERKNNNKNQKISIITTVFNNAKLLEQTIQSVINQSYNEFEYIIKDANSKDNFNEIINKYRPFISKIISAPDRGIYFGMHEGIENSNGEYFAVINSDDIYSSPDIIETYINKINENSNDAYYANILKVFENGKRIIRKGSVENIYRESSINHPTLFLRRSCYENVGGFDLTFKTASDGDLTIKLLKHGFSFCYIDKEVVIFRLGGASKVSFSVFKEELRCRYKYNRFNLIGYLYVLMKYSKHILNVYI